MQQTSKTNAMKTHSKVFFFAILFLIITAFTFAEKQEETATIFQQLNHQELLKVEIETDLDSLLNTKKTEEEIPATFAFEDAAKQKQNWQVKLQVRGKFRRRICEFPPLRLTFPKKN